tara:strand:- start:342 stop:551 length:210 start_codon:yes stop_codon:yes gene_type:complete
MRLFLGNLKQQASSTQRLKMQATSIKRQATSLIKFKATSYKLQDTSTWKHFTGVMDPVFYKDETILWMP